MVLAFLTNRLLVEVRGGRFCDFEVDPLWDKQPSAVLEHKGDVVTRAGVGGLRDGMRQFS